MGGGWSWIIGENGGISQGAGLLQSLLQFLPSAGFLSGLASDRPFLPQVVLGHCFITAIETRRGYLRRKGSGRDSQLYSVSTAPGTLQCGADTDPDSTMFWEMGL